MSDLRALEELVNLNDQKTEVEQRIKMLKRSGEYAKALHQLVEEMPEAVNINYRMLRNRGKIRN